MNHAMIPMKRNRTLKLSDSLMKGLLVRGPSYAIVSGSTAYWLTRLATGREPVYADILREALLLFMPWGLLAGAAEWLLIRHHAEGENRRRKTGRGSNRFMPRGRASGLRPNHA